MDTEITALTKVSPTPTYLLDFSDTAFASPYRTLSYRPGRAVATDEYEGKGTPTSREEDGVLKFITLFSLFDEEISAIVAQVSDLIAWSLMRGGKETAVDRHNRALLRQLKWEQIDRRRVTKL